jgi:hypothetical protein
MRKEKVSKHSQHNNAAVYALAVLACSGFKRNFDFARQCFKEFQIILMMDASVVMKDDKKLKIKTFRAGYARSVTAIFFRRRLCCMQ